MDNFEQLLTVAEVAKLLRVTPYTLFSWCKQGKIQPIRFNARCFRFTRAELSRFVEANSGGKVESNSTPIISLQETLTV